MFWIKSFEISIKSQKIPVGKRGVKGKSKGCLAIEPIQSLCRYPIAYNKMDAKKIGLSRRLEADIVIVINCNSGKYGFPSEMSDDPILNLVLSEADQFENGEERRLFYVAMTRTKEKTFLVADSSYKLLSSA